MDENLRKNHEGYSDPTSYEALNNLCAEEKRFHKLLNTIFYISEMAGFEIQNRVIFVDKRTGRIWK